MQFLVVSRCRRRSSGSQEAAAAAATKKSEIAAAATGPCSCQLGAAFYFQEIDQLLNATPKSASGLVRYLLADMVKTFWV